MTNSLNDNLTISPGYIQQIRDFLEHLYDFPYQQKQTLVLTPTDTGAPILEVAGPKVRKLLLEALEKIGEEKNLAFRSSQARYYNLLRLHYIEGMNINDVARELGLSQRQTYRDLRSADEIIASIVWTQLMEQIPKSTDAPAQPPAVTVGEGSEPAEQQPSLQFQPHNLNELVITISDIVRPLASSRSVDLKLFLPDPPTIIPTDGMVARQVITGLLSMAIQKAQPYPLKISLSTRGKECVLRLTFRPSISPAGELPERFTDPSIGLYAQNLGWRISHQVNADNDVEISVSMQAHLRTCLIIDDHPGFVELLERYVNDSAIYITTAESGPKGVELARQIQPDVIILDVMIPEMDGWQVLQHLHAAPATKMIPIIVCSVFYDPDLALTLGAADVLKKPVRKEDLVNALKNLKIL